MTRHQCGLHMPPVAFDALRVGLSTHEALAVGHTTVAKADTSHFAIAAEFVGVEPRALGHMGLEDAVNLGGGHRGHEQRAHPALPYLQPNHHALVSRTPAALALLTPADVGLIDLDAPAQLAREHIALERIAQPMQQLQRLVCRAAQRTYTIAAASFPVS